MSGLPAPADVLAAVAIELVATGAEHTPIHSVHEALGVILGVRALIVQTEQDFAALRERAERAEAQAAQYAALHERERISALAQHEAQQQRLDAALLRLGELEAYAAAQAQAAQNYLDALAGTGHNAAQFAARGYLMRVLGATAAPSHSEAVTTKGAKDER